MNCAEFADWLDRGRPDEDGPAHQAQPRPERDAARQHAERCPDCAASLRLVRELERASRAPLTTAPVDFTDRVMERLAASEAPARVPSDPESPWPWWIQILLEPSAALGLACGLLYAAMVPTLLGTGTRALPTLVERLSSSLPSLPAVPWLSGLPGLAAVAAALVLSGLGLFRGSRLFFDHLTRLRAR